MNLSVSLLHLVFWLLRTLQASMEAIEKSKPAAAATQLQQLVMNSSSSSSSSNSYRKVELKNYQVALELLKYLTEKEFCLALLIIGRAEEKELHSKIVSKSKMVRCSFYFCFTLACFFRKKNIIVSFYLLSFLSSRNTPHLSSRIRLIRAVRP